MLVKRFKDFLLETRVMDKDGYYYEEIKRDDLGAAWMEGYTYYLRKGKKSCGVIDLIVYHKGYMFIDGVDITPYKDILGDNFIYLFGIRANVKGVGVMLMSKVISESKKLGYDTIILSVHPDEDIEISKLIDFYEHFGFKIFYGKKMISHTILMYLKIN